MAAGGQNRIIEWPRDRPTFLNHRAHRGHRVSVPSVRSVPLCGKKLTRAGTLENWGRCPIDKGAQLWGTRINADRRRLTLRISNFEGTEIIRCFSKLIMVSGVHG